MNIYIGNLAAAISEKDLVTVFSRFGAVDSARLITDQESGRAIGFGFVEMQNAGEAEQAIGELNGSSMSERTLVVNEARSRTSLSRR